MPSRDSSAADIQPPAQGDLGCSRQLPSKINRLYSYRPRHLKTPFCFAKKHLILFLTRCLNGMALPTVYNLDLKVPNGYEILRVMKIYVKN